jgi:hypothetical protein
VDPDDIYFPEAAEIGPHAIAFAQVMFAHSEFEREVRSLQRAITNDPSFGERRSNQWKVRKRPELMAKLIRTHLGDAIVTLCSVTPSFMTCYLRKTTEAPAISTGGG